MRFYLFIIFLLTLSGCIEEYEADISSEYTDLLVVEGTICSSQLNKFILSRTQPLRSKMPENSPGSASDSNGIPQMVMGAKVSVQGSDGSEYAAQETTYGNYTCKIGILSPDVEYYLHIEYDGEVYESEPQKPLRTEKIADVRGVQNTPKSNIDVLVTPDAPFEPDRTNYYSWTYDETWLVYPEYVTNVYFDTEMMMPVKQSGLFPEYGWMDNVGSTIAFGSSSSYDGQHIQRLKMYDIGSSDERVYYRYSGLVHQRAISKGEYEYELAQRQASSEMGGLFTPQPSALPTNIRCLTSRKHVIGFVGCSLNTSEYRFFLNAQDFKINRPKKSDTRVWLDDPSMDDCFRMVLKGFFLCEWQDPMQSDNGKLHTAWARRYQLDVRNRGAYIEEPDFWSLEENVSY